jgi:hypothetical protein
MRRTHGSNTSRRSVRHRDREEREREVRGERVRYEPSLAEGGGGGSGM